MIKLEPNTTPPHVSMAEIREMTIRHSDEVRFNVIETNNHKVHIVALKTVYFSDDFGDSRYFAKKIPEFIKGRFLEIGCGTGVVAIAATLENIEYFNDHTSQFIAVDINHDAVKSSIINSLINACEGKIEFRVSDVFSSIKQDERFDCIFWNHPFHRGNKNEDIIMRACFDPDFKGFEEYVRDGFNYLNKNGKLLLGSGNFADLEDMRDILNTYKCELVLMDYIHRPFEVTSGQLKTFNIYEVVKK
ncbi:methyltransferase [bacterium]|nr:methyltransferase [bacterium]